MKTKAETITQEVEIWARKPQWFRDEDTSQQFVYCVGRPFETFEVMVCKTTVTYDIPEGVDLLSAAVDTLRAKQDEVRARAELEVNSIQKQINELLLIGHESSAVEVAPEMFCPHGVRFGQFCGACDEDGIPF